MKLFTFLKYSLFTSIVLSLLNSTAFSQEPEKAIQTNPVVSDKKPDELNAEQIIEQNKPALISIWYHTSNYYSYYSYDVKDTTLLSGSGFIIDSSGIVGTNFHVVDGIDSLLIKTSDGTFYNAELLIVDAKNDMALLRIQNTDNRFFKTVKLGNSDNVKVGQDVYAIGSPLGYEYTISQGIVAGIRDSEKVSFTDPVTYVPIEKKFEKVIQITAAISPGNSGGALFNTKGDVIGITTYTYVGYGNLNFAIAVNSFIKFKSSIDLTNLDNNEETKLKREESLYSTNLKLANNYKDQVSYNWYYTKEKDTMKTLDTFVVKQDSLVRINYYKAESFYNKCIQMQPDSFSVYQNLMDLYVFTENFNNAEQLYKTIREKFDSDSLLSLLSSSLATAYSSTKEYLKAIQFYEKMLKQDSSDVYIYYQIANIYEQMGNYKKAIRGYNDVIKRDSTYSQAYVELGTIYYTKYKDYQKARQYLEAANENEIENSGYSSSIVDVHYYLGMIACKEGRKLDAILSYMELKNVYSYTTEDNQKKLKLYRAIKNLDN